MTPLGEVIERLIAEHGPMRLDEYMALCLGHPEHGYYTRRDPLGAGGDFTTAPEISQMFGELIGAWLAEVWQGRGAPERFVLAELGPGRGTLMRDALRVAARVPGFASAAELWLVETSPALRARQAELLGPFRPNWAGRLDDLPPGPLFLVANEFFDALPARQFRRADMAWCERLVIRAEPSGLAFAWGPPRPEPELARRFPLAPDGAIVEVNAGAEAAAAWIGARIAAEGGAALVIDYGDWDGTGDTLQAVKAHRFVGALEDPGAADLTTHVRFRALGEAAGPAIVAGPVPQGVFLERLGITARANALARGLAPAGGPDRGGEADAVEAIVRAHRRLTHPDEMGILFRVLGLTSRGSARLPGFDPAEIRASTD
ncbi:class I SAM-dependent methyltransferase [Amaricoccus sp. W119]|uniref:class I SAM-dependent methyltransferase n=1 Tax=Amaricoccus sp. W119 TaxID=3391833 RepID=UPI0039A4E4C8